MAYSARALAMRRCTATNRAGEPCGAFACWNDPLQRCTSHAGRHHVGAMPARQLPNLEGFSWEQLVGWSGPPRTWRGPKCTCAAYPYPHRPAGGRCCWPDPPGTKSATPPRRKRSSGR